MHGSPVSAELPGSGDLAVSGPGGSAEEQTPAPRPTKRRSTAEREGGRPRARRKRRGVSVGSDEPQVETVIMSVLCELQDDVVEAPAREALPPGPPELGICRLTPARTDKVYVQHARGFSQATRERVLRRGPAPQEDRHEVGASPLSTAIALQERLRPVYTLCHGLLAGLALATLLTSYSCGSLSEDSVRLVEALSPSVHTAGTVFYFLCTICTVSVFDRLDVSNMDCTQVVDVVRYQGVGLVIVVVYVFTLVSALACTHWDEGIVLYQRNASHWCSDQELAAHLETWHILSMCRCMGGVLGWFLVAFAPAQDLLLDHLAAMLPYQATLGSVH